MNQAGTPCIQHTYTYHLHKFVTPYNMYKFLYSLNSYYSTPYASFPVSMVVHLQMKINTEKRGHLISPQFTIGHKVLLLKGAV